MLFCLRCNGDETLLDRHISFQLRISDEEWQETKLVFIERGFIDTDNRIINWDKRQYISDGSAVRVQRHREKRKAAGLKAQTSIPKSLRLAVFERDAFACIYCGSTERLTIDHDIPISRGGNDTIDNLQTACLPCNANKRHMTHNEYTLWPGRETLLKRPQSTETEQIKKHKREIETTSSTVGFQMFFEAIGCFDDKDRGKLTQVVDAYCRASGMDVAAGAKHMISRWREIELAADKLEWQYGSSFKFFMGGKWDKPETWPWKPGQAPPKKRSMREDPEFIKAQKVMEDMDNARRKSEAYRKEVADRVAGANDNRTEAHARP